MELFLVAGGQGWAQGPAADTRPRVPRHTEGLLLLIREHVAHIAIPPVSSRGWDRATLAILWVSSFADSRGDQTQLRQAASPVLSVVPEEDGFLL